MGRKKSSSAKSTSKKQASKKQASKKQASKRQASMKSTSKKQASMKQLTKKALPSYDTCNKVTSWHFPWNAKVFKKKCQDNDCLWTKSAFGSYCFDPYTVTRKKINGMGLSNPIVQASMSVSELKRHLKTCNAADEDYYNVLVSEFLQSRIHNIEVIVVSGNANLVLKSEDHILEKIIANAKKENLNDIKTLSELKLIKINQQEICFNQHLGHNRYRYQYMASYELQNKLNLCGINSSSYLYSIAHQNFRLYSDFSPLRSRRRSIRGRHHHHNRSRRSLSRRHHHPHHRR
jgi:hypothetical protein